MTAQGSTDMLRRLAAVAACVPLLALVPTGSAYVTTLPTGADVWLDGVYAGRSPVVLDGLVKGRHTVGVAKTGWSSRQLDLSVEPGQTTLSSTRLERARGAAEGGSGTIAVHGMQARAVRIDGAAERPGKDGAFPAGSGLHQLVMETRAGRVTREVTVWPNTRTDVIVTAEAPEARKPSVVAPAEDFLPKSAVRLDGERLVIRYGGHEVVGRVGELAYRVDGRAVSYDAAPALVGPRLYLPIDLLTLLTKNHER